MFSRPCIDCGDIIPSMLIQAIPTTIRCIKCQSQRACYFVGGFLLVLIGGTLLILAGLGFYAMFMSAASAQETPETFWNAFNLLGFSVLGFLGLGLGKGGVALIKFRKPALHPKRRISIVEVAIVFVIIWILAVISRPADCSYSARAQVSEGLSIALEMQQPIEQYWRETGRFPDGLTDLGRPEPRWSVPKSIERIEWRDGGLVIRMSEAAHRDVRGGALHVRVATNDRGELAWVCGYAAVPEGYRLSHPNRTDLLRKKDLPFSCKSGPQSPHLPTEVLRGFLWSGPPKTDCSPLRQIGVRLSLSVV